MKELRKIMDEFLKELAANSRPIGEVPGFVPEPKTKKKKIQQ